MGTWTLRVYTWGLAAMAFAVLAGGCGVSPELQAKLDAAISAEAQVAGKVLALAQQLERLTSDFKAGKLDATTFGEVKTRLETALNEAKESAAEARLKRLEAQQQANAEKANGWSIAGAVVVNLLLRLVGVPGFASSGGGNLVTAARKLTGKGNGT